MRLKIRRFSIVLAIIMLFSSCVHGIGSTDSQTGSEFQSEVSSEYIDTSITDAKNTDESDIVLETTEPETTALETTEPETTEPETTELETTESETTALETTEPETTEPETTEPETTESETTEPETTEPETTESETTESETTEPETGESDIFDERYMISRSREELEAMLTVTDEDFAEADRLLASYELLSIYGSDINAAKKAYSLLSASIRHIRSQVSIASLIYYMDRSDKSAYERYIELYDGSGKLTARYTECQRKIYISSPMRDELFAGWSERDIKDILDYSGEVNELKTNNKELKNQLGDLSGEEYSEGAAVIYAQLVQNCNRIAEIEGYGNYYDYASKEIYHRDYGRAELDDFSIAVADIYIPLFEQLNCMLESRLDKLDDSQLAELEAFSSAPFDSLDRNYLYGYLSSLSGSMRDGMLHALTNRNIVFADNANSHGTAVQMYIYDLNSPFCLFGSRTQYTTAIVHELGHYYGSLYSRVSSYDLAELQSQGNEMLLLAYMQGEMESELFSALELKTLCSSLRLIAICTIVDEFEREVYSLDSVDGYTSCEFDAIMSKVCEKYGGIEHINSIFNIDMNRYWRKVGINNPVYYVSYATSMASVLNIYSVLKEDTAKGREIYRSLVEDVNKNELLLSALEKVGLSSPFDVRTAEQIASIIPIDKCKKQLYFNFYEMQLFFYIFYR